MVRILGNKSDNENYVHDTVRSRLISGVFEAFISESSTLTLPSKNWSFK
jgi:hypothetical protein